MKLVLFASVAGLALAKSSMQPKTAKNPAEIKLRKPHVPKPHTRSKRSASRQLTDTERAEILAAHNNWRAKAARGELTDGLKAKKMEQMYWDSELEEHSKAYANQCIWAHSQPQGFDQLGYSYGENLFITSRTGISDLAQAVDSWSMEHLDYNHLTGECTPGAMCGHYTQVVWETTTRVGCAITECDSVQGLSWGGSLIVCQYYTSGNYYGELPYAAGETQEDCDSESGDYDGLCGNSNGICGAENRCRTVETCVTSGSLGGEPTAYTCEPMESSCSFTEVAGYEINWPYDGYNGMVDSSGSWKYCYGDMQGCQDWCLLNKESGCVGLTESSSNPGFYFPVNNLSDKAAVQGNSYWELTCQESANETEQQPTQPTVYYSCDDMPCSHACFKNSENVAQCACPKGLTLLENEMDCGEVSC